VKCNTTKVIPFTCPVYIKDNADIFVVTVEYNFFAVFRNFYALCSTFGRVTQHMLKRMSA